MKVLLNACILCFCHGSRFSLAFLSEGYRLGSPKNSPRDEFLFPAISPLPAPVAVDPQPNEALPWSVPAHRALEIGQVVLGRFLLPVLSNLASQGIPDNWDSFWSQTAAANGTATNAQRLAAAVEALGPTYVKFAQALSSRPDVVPPSLADALCILQDEMEPFDSEIAKEIVRSDLASLPLSRFPNDSPHRLEEFLQSLSVEPVAAASVGQVFSAHLPGYGKVAVKVKRPGIREVVERDAVLLTTLASWIESIPAIPSLGMSMDPLQQPPANRLIHTELVRSVNEFMSRLFEELDFSNEAANMDKFASLYSVRRGSTRRVKVVVPEVFLDLCTDNVIVMEWIEGTKLTNVIKTDGDARSNAAARAVNAENLALVRLCIDCTLSQLLDTGVLHADPHGGNLLKVKRQQFDEHHGHVNKAERKRRWLKRNLQKLTRRSSLTDQLPQLGYLDFGMVSTVNAQVQDALVCAIVLLVFARDVERVAGLFGELQLLPEEVVHSPQEIAALENALNQMFDDILTYPNPDSLGEDRETQIPSLRFDRLLDSMTRLIPRFRFDLPPYFLNNARALSTLEGIARSLDPSFSVLQVVYPYALNRMLRNPSDSPIVDDTLQRLIRSKKTGRIVREKVWKLLDDASLITGFSRQKVMLDILKTRGGLRLAQMMVQEGFQDYMFPRQMKRRRKF